jgi:SHS family sialic acid transporter-like MFS transporter
VVSDYTTFAGVKGGYAVACSFVIFVYAIGLIVIWFAPETKGKPLPD